MNTKHNNIINNNTDKSNNYNDNKLSKLKTLELTLKKLQHEVREDMIKNYINLVLEFFNANKSLQKTVLSCLKLSKNGIVDSNEFYMSHPEDVNKSKDERRKKHYFKILALRKANILIKIKNNVLMLNPDIFGKKNLDELLSEKELTLNMKLSAEEHQIKTSFIEDYVCFEKERDDEEDDEEDEDEY